jgi:hypothetical protein
LSLLSHFVGDSVFLVVRAVVVRAVVRAVVVGEAVLGFNI